MLRAEQGDILRISGISWPVIVVSNNHFNQIGEAVVCPILNNITQNAIHLPIRISSPAGAFAPCGSERETIYKAEFTAAD